MQNNTLLTEQWSQWAIQIQSIAQNGLAYSQNIYDIERYEQLRRIAAEMLSYKTAILLEKVTLLFCHEPGYQTPKINTRAAVFSKNKILLVQESDGRWALPGGWCDVLETISSNTVKEVREEAGLNVTPQFIIALQDQHKRNFPPFVYSVLKVFVMCKSLGGEFVKNSETIASAYFTLDELPPLAQEKNSKEQIALCFKAHTANNWQTQFD